MPACADCSSWMSSLFNQHIQAQERINSDGQERNRRSVLSVRQSSKVCIFCNFLSSEIQIYGQKRDLDIADNHSVLLSGKWRRYNFNGERGGLRVLEAIWFQVYIPTGDASRPWQYKYYIGAYPVCIEAGGLLIQIVKDKNHPLS
jgi:hypothetical protein